jgi:hypothetical protein
MIMVSDLILEEKNIKQAVRIMMAEANVDTIASLARSLDVKETTLRSALNNNALRLKDFIKISDFMGYEVVIQKKEQ